MQIWIGVAHLCIWMKEVRGGGCKYGVHRFNAFADEDRRDDLSWGANVGGCQISEL